MHVYYRKTKYWGTYYKVSTFFMRDGTTKSKRLNFTQIVPEIMANAMAILSSF